MNFFIESFKDRFLDVNFIESSHEYFFKGKKFLSITSLLKQYQNFFNQEEVIERILKNNPEKTRDEILQEWHEKNVSSVKKGKAIHKFIEETLKNNVFVFSQPYLQEKTQFRNFYMDFLKDKKIIYIEKQLYSVEDSIAGTIDCLVWDEKEKILYYIDWKTNNEIKNISYMNEKFKFPLNQLNDCNYELYSLQLSFYRYMIEKEVLKNFKISEFQSKNLIVQFNDSLPNYKIYELPYRLFSVFLILKHLKEKERG